jgi:hypothetical protein
VIEYLLFHVLCGIVSLALCYTSVRGRAVSVSEAVGFVVLMLAMGPIVLGVIIALWASDIDIRIP